MSDRPAKEAEDSLCTDDMRCMGELFFRAVERFDDAVAMRHRQPDRWVDITWEEFGVEVRRLAAGLIGLGVGKGDRVSILANSRPEWAIIDQATMAIGAVTVPIYQSNLPHEVKYILDHAGSKVVFVEDSEQMGKVLEVRAELPGLKHAVLMEGKVKTDEGFRLAFDKLQDRGKEALERSDAALWPGGEGGPYRVSIKKEGTKGDPFKAWQETIGREDLATIVYTSGTTGPPKGAMLTHGSLLFEMEALAPSMGVDERDETLLFLPMAHIFARVGYLASLRTGYTVSFAESIERLMDNIAEVRPTFVFSVPRIYEKVYNKVVSGVQSGSRLKKQLFAFAMFFGQAASRWLRRPAAQCRKANLVAGGALFVICLLLAAMWLEPHKDLSYHLGSPPLKPIAGPQFAAQAVANDQVQVTGKLVPASLERRMRGDRRAAFLFALEGYPADLAVHLDSGETFAALAEADDSAGGDEKELGDEVTGSMVLRGRLYRGLAVVDDGAAYTGWKKADTETGAGTDTGAETVTGVETGTGTGTGTEADEADDTDEDDDEGAEIDAYLGGGTKKAAGTGKGTGTGTGTGSDDADEDDDEGSEIDAYLGGGTKKAAGTGTGTGTGTGSTDEGGDDDADDDEDDDEGSDIDSYLGGGTRKETGAKKPEPKQPVKKQPAVAAGVAKRPAPPAPRWLLMVGETPAAGNLWGTRLPLFVILLLLGIVALVKIVTSKKGVPFYLDFGYQASQMLVFNKLKNLFGGELRFFISGGAPLSREIAEFFHAAGILVLEGYGLTENTAACNLNTHDAFKLGTVGRSLPGVEVRIADDGEIMLRGPNVFAGYYDREEATAEAMEEDGWFHTGDIGVFDDDGYLTITDRKKDLIVTSGGKNIAPQNIENLMKTDPLISQIMVYGDKRNFLTALVTLDPDEAASYAEHKEIEYEELSELAEDPQINEKMERVIQAKNKKLASYETIKKFAILPEDFEIGEELTPTLKVKRKFTIEKYWDILDALYIDTRGKKS